MKRSFFIVAIVASAYFTQGQNQHLNQIQAQSLIDRMNMSGGVANGDLMWGIPMPPGKLVGDFYLDSEWKKGTLILYENESIIKNYKIRYDLHLNEFEIKTLGGVRVLPGAKVKSFAIEEDEDDGTNAAYYFNAKEFIQTEPPNFDGFYKVRVAGQMMLLSRTDVFIKKGNYKQEFSIGNPDDKIVKRQIFCYSKDGKVFMVPQNRKKLVEIFGQHKNAMNDFIESKNMSVKNEHTLDIIFFEYNRKTESDQH
jgi:hypothetical protein